MNTKFKIIVAKPNKIPLKQLDLHLENFQQITPDLQYYMVMDKQAIQFEVPTEYYDELRKLLRWRGWEIIETFDKKSSNSQLEQLENMFNNIKYNADRALKSLSEIRSESEKVGSSPTIYQVVDSLSNYINVIDLELDKIWDLK